MRDGDISRYTDARFRFFCQSLKMETDVKLSLAGKVVVKTTGNGNIEELAGQASVQLGAKAYMTLSLEVESPELKESATCKIKIPTNVIMDEVKQQVTKIMQQASRDKDMKQFSEAKRVFEEILKTMKAKYPDFQSDDKDKVPSFPKAGVPALARKQAAKAKPAAPGQTSRDQSPVRSSSDSSFSESDNDEVGTGKTQWDEPGTISKFEKEWQELWPAFKAFALDKESLWEKQDQVYERFWNENAFFVKAMTLLLPQWTDKHNNDVTKVSLMAWILRQHRSHCWHEMKQSDVTINGTCQACGGAGALSWKFLADPKNPVGVLWYHNACGKSLKLIYDFLSATHVMIKEKRRTKGNLGGALRWWCLLVDALDDIAERAKK